jgi:hypothetical protein
MRILLKLVLDTSPDSAWRAIRDPRVFAAVSAPLMQFRSQEPRGFPSTWATGAHRVTVHAFGIIPVGEQVIDISFPERSDGVRMMRDAGGAISGPLSFVSGWDHRMAVSPLPDGRTLYRDRLEFSAGAATVLLWPVYWAFWQWRSRGLVRLARTW